MKNYSSILVIDEEYLFFYLIVQNYDLKTVLDNVGGNVRKFI